MKSFNKNNYDLRTVSGRLNALLDFSDDYSPPDNGRAKELAEEYNGSKSGAHNWILHNQLPTRKQLREIVERSLLKINGHYSLGAAIAWIEHGEVVPCPFVESSGGQATVHKFLGPVYIACHEVAKSMDIENIYSMLENHVIDAICGAVLRDMLKKTSSKPDKKLIVRLIKKALKEKERLRV